MEQGSLEERVLTRSVTKHIKKQNKRLAQGTGVGHDFAMAESVIVTEAVSTSPELAWVKALNNFYVSGGEPVLARIVALLPADTREGAIKEYMNAFNRLAECEGVQLAGGHSQVSTCYNEISYVVTVTGHSGMYSHNKKLIKPGAEIIMTGYSGMLGTDLIVRDRAEDLKKRFSSSYINEKTPWNSKYSVREPARFLASCDNVYYMHDVSHGGVYGALWQLGAYASRGISVGHFSIPVLQSTIEFCEIFGLNPYMVEGTGALLAIVEAGCGVEMVDKLNQNGINASVIGHVEANNERMIYLGEALSVSAVEKSNPDAPAFFIDAENRYIERRCLAPVKGDHIYNVTDRL